MKRLGNSEPKRRGLDEKGGREFLHPFTPVLRDFFSCVLGLSFPQGEAGGPLETS